MKSKIIAFAKRYAKDLLFLIVLLIGIDWWQSRHLLGGSLPINLKTEIFAQLEGDATQLLQGRSATLVYIFAPWCGVCRLSAHHLNGLKSESLQVKSLALSWKDAEDVRKFVAETGLEGPVLLGSESAGEALQVDSFPSYYLISGEGEVLRAWSGYTSKLGLWLRSRRF